MEIQEHISTRSKDWNHSHHNPQENLQLCVGGSGPGLGWVEDHSLKPGKLFLETEKLVVQASLWHQKDASGIAAVS